jgi:hypothetical protein
MHIKTMSIKDVAERAGVTVKAVRYYESRGGGGGAPPPPHPPVHRHIPHPPPHHLGTHCPSPSVKARC